MGIDALRLEDACGRTATINASIGRFLSGCTDADWYSYIILLRVVCTRLDAIMVCEV